MRDEQLLMEVKMSLPVITLLVMAITIATALPPVDNFREGSCSGVRSKPITASREFIDKLKYIPSGNQYDLYSLASSTPNYASMREDEFYYDACFSRNTSSVTEGSTASIFGFGQTLSTFRPVTRPGIYLEAIPTNPSLSWNTIVDTVTLTDYKTFAFLSNCWTGVDQRGWIVVSILPNLDSQTEKIIEDHAISLGFKKDNFLFLRHDSCRLGLGNPYLGQNRRRPPVHPIPLGRHQF